VVYQSAGAAFLVLGSYMSRIPLPPDGQNTAAWAEMGVPSVVFLGLGCWICCGFFPFSSSLLSMISTARDNFVHSLLYAQGISIICLRFAAPLLLSHPALRTCGIAIAGATMIACSLMLLIERKPRMVGALLFLSQLSFGVLSLAGSASSPLLGLRLSIELALAALTGVLLVSSFLVLRLGRGYSESCTGLAAPLPGLACCFLICLLSFIGFPGTVGFVAEEILIGESFRHRSVPLACAAAALAVNGFSCFRLFGKIFLGEDSVDRVSEFRLRLREKCALACVAAMLIVPGVVPAVAYKFFH
jgi:NADH-quinone oxidoreductase subunit M